MNKKIAALVSIFAIAVTGNALALETQTGSSYQVDTDALDAFDCGEDFKWEQLPNGGAGVAAQDDECYPFLAESADNFVGDGEMMIGAGWWGDWDGSAMLDAFEITIYADSGNGPGEMIYTEVVTDYNETAGAPFGYCALLSEPVMKADGETYWIDITSIYCFQPQWFWSVGDGDGQEIYFKSDFFGFPDWVPGSIVFGGPRETAFLLYNEGGGVPTEEATWSEIKALY